MLDDFASFSPLWFHLHSCKSIGTMWRAAQASCTLCLKRFSKNSDAHLNWGVTEHATRAAHVLRVPYFDWSGAVFGAMRYFVSVRFPAPNSMTKVRVVPAPFCL